MDLQRAIASVEQADDESLYDYIERFTRFCATCPFHGFSERDLVFNLYNGFLTQERRLVYAACNGSIMNLIPFAARTTMNDIAESTRGFGKIYKRKDVHAANVSATPEWKDEIAELKSMIKNLGPGNQQARVCGICADGSHPTDACPQLQDTTAEVNVAGGFGPPRPGFERQCYNNRANDHPGFVGAI